MEQEPKSKTPAMPTSMGQMISSLSAGHSDLDLLNKRIWCILENVQGVIPIETSIGELKAQHMPDCYLGLLQTEVNKQMELINSISIGVNQLAKHL